MVDNLEESHPGDADPRQRFRRLLAEEEEKLPEVPQEEDTAPLPVDRAPISPPPFGGRTPDEGDQPEALAMQVISALPRPVGEKDIEGTRVTSSAYKTPTPIPGEVARIKPAPRVAGRTERAIHPPLDIHRLTGCFLRALFISLFAGILLALCLASILTIQYYRIAKTLPTIGDLRQRTAQFETTRILDRQGNTLYEILDPNAGRRTYVPLSKISPFLVAATIATEDKGFYGHPGFDPLAIARAFWQNYQGGETVSGASTITQQLARMLLFSPEERAEITYERKIREAVLAAEITRRYSKDEILELYLNEINYGSLAYGIEAAAETYFSTTADKLTLGQAAFLAGLPQAPGVYDVFTNPEVTFGRLENVLVLVYRASEDEDCIFVSNSPEKVCVDPVAVTNAVREIRSYAFIPPRFDIRYPHWVFYIRSLLEEQYDAQTIYRSGFTVYTTLDPALQDIAQEIVKDQVSSLADRHATDGALVAIRPATGEILAMVGSADFYNEAISGQVNMSVSPRQPGSSIKPLTYLAAFEKGWTPASLIWDVPSEFPPSGRPDDLRPSYEPVNYDGRFHGPVTVRYALANSYNMPAVKTLQFVGIYDAPEVAGEDGLLAFARRMGITTLTRPDYGLSLTLGGGEVTLLEMTSAFATIANNGRRIPPVAITRILDHSGSTIYEYQPVTGEQAMRAEHAFLMTSILSDNQARASAFGADSVLKLPFPAAVKTGTTNDFRDNWTLGYTPDIAIGVWVGNADYSPMQNTSGLTGAAPIWAKAMKSAIQFLTNDNPSPFSHPPGVVELPICAISGTTASKWCPEQRMEYFAADQPPLPKEQDLWQKTTIDTWTGLRVSPDCAEFVAEIFALNATDPWARKWIQKDAQGANWAEQMGFDRPVVYTPERECRSDDPRPRLSFGAPGEGQTITTNPLDIYAIADATQWYDYMRLEYGLGTDPRRWKVLVQDQRRSGQPELIYSWDLSEIPAGSVTLRLYIHSTKDTYAVKVLHLDIQVPTPTPFPTPTLYPTATPTPTPEFLWPTETPTPVLIPTQFPTPTSELLPTSSPH